MKIYDVIILGAGASGLMCAGNIGKKKSVLIIEGNEKVAKKVKISGGGKCNITNIDVQTSNFDGEELLVRSVLQKFSKENLLEFLDRNRVELELRKNRYYFCQNSSDDIINVLKKAAQYAELLLNEKIVSTTKEDDIFTVKTDKNSYKAQKVVVATGGISFVNLGASKIGLDIAKSFEIESTAFTPALVGLTVQKE
ncbi:MAG: NAD(P)/FAD-dependent oxidoreductase, partial [Sulfurimonas sp.]|nr:NAD(P)/FAD-dependent oxidoreductase [Sulfurimonas sp.]